MGHFQMRLFHLEESFVRGNLSYRPPNFRAILSKFHVSVVWAVPAATRVPTSTKIVILNLLNRTKVTIVIVYLQEFDNFFEAIDSSRLDTH